MAKRFRSERILASISQLGNGRTTLRSGTRVPKGGFAAAKHPSKWRFGCKTLDLKAWKVGSHFATTKRVYLAAKWHSCAKGLFTAAKIFAEGARRLRNGFATKIDFCSEERDFRSGS